MREPFKMRLGVALTSCVSNGWELNMLRQQMLGFAATWLPLYLRVQCHWIDNASSVPLPQPVMPWPTVLDKREKRQRLDNLIAEAIQRCFDRDADCVAVVGPNTWTHPDWIQELVSLVDTRPSGRLWSCAGSVAYPVLSKGKSWVQRDNLDGTALLIPRVSWEDAKPSNGNWLTNLVTKLRPGPFYETDKSFVRHLAA